MGQKCQGGIKISWTDKSSVSVIKYLKEKYHLDTLVETGAYKGINAKVTYNNFLIEEEATFDIIESSILITSDFGNLVGTNKEPNIYTIQFETKSSQGELIDTSNTIEISKGSTPTPDKIDNPTRISKGVYSFSYDFTEQTTYIIKIISSSSDYNQASSLTSGAIPISSGGVTPEEEASNTLIFVVIGIAVLIIVGVIIFFAVRRRK